MVRGTTTVDKGRTMRGETRGKGEAKGLSGNSDAPPGGEGLMNNGCSSK